MTNKIKDFRDLDVWKKGIEIVKLELFGHVQFRQLATYFGHRALPSRPSILEN